MSVIWNDGDGFMVAQLVDSSPRRFGSFGEACAWAHSRDGAAANPDSWMFEGSVRFRFASGFETPCCANGLASAFWPGGYAAIYLTDDGASLCGVCASEHSVGADVWPGDGWFVIGASHSGECDDLTVCDHCGMVLAEGEEG